MKRQAIDFKNPALEEHFSPILSRWIKNIDKYSVKAGSYDSLYWNIERANLSIFAAAAWQCGYFAQEEYSYEKRNEDKSRYLGRVDMWLSCDGHDYIFEAKQVYVSISQKSNAYKSKIKRVLQDARDAAKRSRDKGDTALGLVFIVPYFHKEEKKPKACINDLINFIVSIDYGFMAYTFPKNSAQLESGNYLFPGIVLIGRRPRR